MAFIGADGFESGMVASDFLTRGIWANDSTATGQGSRYGGGQYRTLQYAVYIGNTQQPYVRDVGALMDFYNAGGFTIGFWAGHFLAFPKSIASSGTDLYGMNDLSEFYRQGPNPLEWTPVSTGLAQNAMYPNCRILWKDGKIITAGTNGSSATYIASGNTDGSGWTQSSFMTSGGGTVRLYDLRCLKFLNGNYWLTGQEGTSSVRRSLFAYNASLTGSWRDTYNPAGNTATNGFDIDYVPWLDLYIATGRISGVGFITTSADPTAATPTWTQRFTGTNAGCVSIAYSDDTVIVVGQDSIVTSADGISWVARTRPVSDLWYRAYYYNGEFVVVGMQYSLYSTDGITWQSRALPFGFSSSSILDMYECDGELLLQGRSHNSIMKYAGQGKWVTVLRYDNTATGTAANTNASGFFFGNSATARADVGNIGSLNSRTGFLIYQTTLNLVCAGPGSPWSNLQQTPLTTNRMYHFELIATAVPGQSVPTFTVQYVIDGEIQNITPITVTAASTSQRLYVTTSCSGFNIYDDFSWSSGTSVLGEVRVIPRNPSTDVQAQWIRNPSGAASNAVAATGLVSDSITTSDVTSEAVNSEDIYNLESLLAMPGFRIGAVSASAFLQRVGVNVPTVELSIADESGQISTQTILDGTTGTSVYASVNATTDSNGDPWTSASAASVKVGIKQTT